MLQLRNNLFWCDCAGRALFLDVAADRYFCLPSATNEAFRRLAHGASVSDDAAPLTSLVEQGVLIESDTLDAIRQPPAIAPPTADWPTGPSSNPGPLAVMCSLAAEVRAAHRHRTRSFGNLIELARHRNGPVPSIRSTRPVATIVAAATIASFVLRAHDRCLVRALAVHSICGRRGIPSKLVFGVIGHPFAAHCWVQLGDKVLVGAFEQARLYTPILVVE